MIDSFVSNQPIFQPPHSHDFMDPKNNIYTPKFACHESKVFLHNHDSSMQDDYDPFMYSSP
jgi:hypothetical protein